MKTIVLDYERHPAQRALERAAELARVFGAKVVVTSVAAMLVGRAGPARSTRPTHPTTTSSELMRAASFLAERWAVSPLDGDYDLALGDPADHIVGLAEQRGADLIVVGTHEPSFLERLLGLSVSRKVERRAHCDVLIVHLGLSWIAADSACAGRRWGRRGARGRAGASGARRGRVTVELLAPEPHFWYRPLAVAEPFALGKVRLFELSELATPRLAPPSPPARSSPSTRIAASRIPRPAARSRTRRCSSPAAQFRDRPSTALSRSAGTADTGKIEDLLAEIEAGVVRRVAFACRPARSGPCRVRACADDGGLGRRPGASTAWSSRSSRRRTTAAALRTRSERGGAWAPRRQRDIAVHTRAYPAEARAGELASHWPTESFRRSGRRTPEAPGPADRRVPQTFEGFVPVDPHGRVTGLSHVYAAGDITTFHRQAGWHRGPASRAAAEAIAEASGPT